MRHVIPLTLALTALTLTGPATAHFDPGDILNGAPPYLRTLNEQGPPGMDGPQFPARYIAVRVDCRVVRDHSGTLYLVKSRAYPTSDTQQQSNDWYDASGFHDRGRQTHTGWGGLRAALILGIV